MKRDFLKKVGEGGLIRWISDHHPDRGDGILLGIGDDAAALMFSQGKAVLASADIVVEGVHFSRGYFQPWQIGRKAVAVNASDMAAMGAEGRFILLQIGLPDDTDGEFFKGCLNGLINYAASTGLSLVGGDMSSTGGSFFMAVTILGEAPPDGILTRGGAQPGDCLLVSGSPGESAAGLALLKTGTSSKDGSLNNLMRRHLEPEPRTSLGQLAAQSGAVTAAIDISDGLSTDLGHLCEAGNIGVDVDAAAIPLSDDLKYGADFLGSDPLNLALHGGEDYELLLAVRAEEAARLLAEAKRSGHALTAIGRFTSGESRAFLVSSHDRKPLHPGGFNHFR